jgi:hypothetical protein
MARHEMWRDELQAWMIARDATGLFNLWQNLRYEGHPSLWYLLLFTLSRFFRNPASMQVLHLVLASTGIFIFLRFARLPRLHKAMYAFGFFPLYQYAIISRCYALGILLAMGYCALTSAGRHSGYLGALALALLANTSAYGWLLAIALGAVLLVPNTLRTPHTLHRLIPIAVLLCGLTISIVTMYPPADQSFGGIGEGLLSWNVPWSWGKASRAVSSIGAIYLSMVVSMPMGLAATVSVLSVICFALAFSRQRTALTVYLISLVSMVAFKYLIYMGRPWHDGHFLLALIVCWWLYSCLPQRALSQPSLNAASLACNRLLPGVIAVFLALHILSAFFSVVQEWKEPYSGSKDVAQFIMNSELRDSEVLGDADYAVSSFAGYLDRPIYYLASKSWGTFIVWNNKRSEIEGNQDELQQRIRQYTNRGGRSVLVLNYRLAPQVSITLGARHLFTSPPAIFADERFWVYNLPQP